MAVAPASLLNFVGAFISLKVAATVGQGFVSTDAVTTTVVTAGLIGAISWNLITWYYSGRGPHLCGLACVRDGALGPVLISVALLSVLTVGLSRRPQDTTPAPASA